MRAIRLALLHRAHALFIIIYTFICRSTHANCSDTATYMPLPQTQTHIVPRNLAHRWCDIERKYRVTTIRLYGVHERIFKISTQLAHIFETALTSH